jgi:hypothetical protein
MEGMTLADLAVLRGSTIFLSGRAKKSPALFGAGDCIYPSRKTIV